MYEIYDLRASLKRQPPPPLIPRLSRCGGWPGPDLGPDSSRRWVVNTDHCQLPGDQDPANVATHAPDQQVGHSRLLSEERFFFINFWFIESLSHAFVEKLKSQNLDTKFRMLDLSLSNLGPVEAI